MNPTTRRTTAVLSTIAIVGLFTVSPNAASAQGVLDYVTRIQGGFGAGVLTVDYGREEGASRKRVVDYSGAGLTFGWDLPVLPIVRHVGVAVSGAGRFLIAPDANVGFYTNVTLLGIVRYGSDATWGWRPLFGLGLGFGYQWVYKEWEVDYWAPAVSAEISLLVPKVLPAVWRLQYVTEIGRTSPTADNAPRSYRAHCSGLFLTMTTPFGRRLTKPSTEVK